MEAALAVAFRLALLFMLGVVFGMSCLLVMKWVGAKILGKPHLAERHALMAVFVLVLYGAAGWYAFRVEPECVAETRLRITASRLIGPPLVIAHLSDLHIDPDSAPRLEKVLALVGAARPHLVVLTGDYLNRGPRDGALLRRFARELCAEAPVYAVWGNWDSETTTRLLSEAGVTVLRDRAVVAREGLVVAGIDFSSTDALPRLLGAPRAPCSVVLSHSPHRFPQAAQLGADLYLCGHTHGGQVRLPLLGTLCPFYGLVGKYQAGVYREGGTTMYVNRGVGMEGMGAPRLRFCCSPEAAILTLTPAGGPR